MILSNLRFLELASTDKVYTPLKSFSDTLLFYYLGSLALTNDGDLLEIGCGGSTCPLYELSEKSGRLLTICDLNELFKNTHLTHYKNANVNPIIDNSKNLINYEIGPFVYSHVDGDKDFKVTKQDLEYCIDNIAVNGIICQDDYGNNKWPTITHVVDQLVHENKLKFVIIGDSSAWLTTPEYYDYWMNLLSTDREFQVLSWYVGLQQSAETLSCTENYYFINCINIGFITGYNVDKLYWREKHEIKSSCSDAELEALYDIHKYLFSSRYLQMPYRMQSIPGYWLN